MVLYRLSDMLMDKIYRFSLESRGIYGIMFVGVEILPALIEMRFSMASGLEIRTQELRLRI